MPEFVEFAARHGVRAVQVRAVQVRPLVAAGRVVGTARLSEDDQQRLWLMAQRLALAYAGEVAGHVDLAPAAALVADAGAWDGLMGVGARLSDRVNPLVVTPEGEMKPFTFDFPPGFDLGPIEGLGSGLAKDRLAAVAAVTERASRLPEGQAGFVDWFAYLRDVARGEVPQPA